MKVVLLVPMGGADKSYSKGEIIETDEATALRLIGADAAEPSNKKEYEEILQKIADEENKKLEDEKKASAILYKDELRKEKEKLLSRVDEIDSLLEPKEETK